MITPEERRVHYSEPVYAIATKIYNASILGRLFALARIEGDVKGEHWQAGAPSESYPRQTAAGFHETIQSKLARVRPTLEVVDELQFAMGTVNIGG
jgi:hypothetical protein